MSACSFLKIALYFLLSFSVLLGQNVVPGYNANMTQGVYGDLYAIAETLFRLIPRERYALIQASLQGCKKLRPSTAQTCFFRQVLPG